jgi:transcriptional regulator with XRE-family HTH domain
VNSSVASPRTWAAKRLTRDRPPTIRDIAREAGVAPSTVSRVLNNASSPVAIGSETRERVLEAAAGFESPG